jgi:hypothetical protein
MNKSIALTFTAAVVLVLSAVAASIYGHQFNESQMAAQDGSTQFTMYDCDGIGLQTDSWDNAASVLVMLAVSVPIAGGMLWDKEIRPQTKQRSILGLEGEAAGRIARTTAPRKSVVSEETHARASSTWPSEAERLTPLERVTRGY